MNLSKNILVLLPDKIQDRIMNRVISSGKWKTIPTFHMLFTSYEIMGADHEDLIQIFNTSQDMGRSLYDNCRKLAKNRTLLAQNASNNKLQTFQKAIMLYFLADWVSDSDELINPNEKDLLAVSTQMEAICNPKVEKVYLSWKNGSIAIRFRKPLSASVTNPAPVILVFQGNDTIKETLFNIEEILLKGGLAVLNIDQPGWGESRLSGIFFDTMDEMPAVASVLLNFVESQPELNSTRICVMGFSGGGTYAAIMASVEPHYKCFVSYGGGIYNLENAIRTLPSNQKRQVMKHWGCTQKELNKRLDELHYNEILKKITAKTLIIHGEKDTLMPLNEIKKAIQLIPGPKDLHFVPDGDHMCSTTMISTEIPFMVKWIHENL